MEHGMMRMEHGMITMTRLAAQAGCWICNAVMIEDASATASAISTGRAPWATLPRSAEVCGALPPQNACAPMSAAAAAMPSTATERRLERRTAIAVTEAEVALREAERALRC